MRIHFELSEPAGPAVATGDYPTHTAFLVSHANSATSSACCARATSSPESARNSPSGSTPTDNVHHHSCVVVRTAVLKIDRSTVLPLMYEYDESAGCYSGMGHVRVGSVMVPGVEHPGPDRVSDRDQFLMKVLASVLIPERRAKKIVKKAEHDPNRPTPPG